MLANVIVAIIWVGAAEDGIGDDADPDDRVDDVRQHQASTSSWSSSPGSGNGNGP